MSTTDKAGQDREGLAIVVHELRSPVAALEAVRRALDDDGAASPGRPELVRLAIAACHAIARLVGDASAVSVRSVRVDVEKLLNEAANAARIAGARVRTLAEPGLSTVLGDPVRLRQVVDNLVANAVAYSRPGEEIVLAARSSHDEVHVSVTDEGPGIPHEQQERIFEAGVRLDDRPGSGLGLAVSRAIAAAHGGELVLESRPGAGAIFTLVLPSARGRESD